MRLTGRRLPAVIHPQQIPQKEQVKQYYTNKIHKTMKKHILTLSALAVAFLLLPCCQKVQSPVAESENFTIKAEMESPNLDSGEKTHLGPTDNEKTPILWSKDDNICLFDGYSKLEFRLETGENTESASFSCPQHPATTDAYCAFYPIVMGPSAQLYDGSYAVTFSLPQTQTYRKPTEDGSPTLAENTLPMIAYANSTDDEFIFRTPMAILKVDLIGTGWVDRMVLTDLDESTQLWGMATVTVSSDTDSPEILSEDISNGNNTLTLDCLHTRLNESIPTSFYFVVPAGTLCDENGQGFKIDVYDLDNHCFTIDESGMNGGFIQRATIYTLTHNEMMELDNITGIKGLFSVSKDKQVFFSQGNLWHQTIPFGDGKWHIENTQVSYDIHEGYLGNYGYFYWNNSSQDYSFNYGQYSLHPEQCTINDVFFTNSRNEDGVEHPNPNFSVRLDDETDQAGIWRTLSAEEWMYLFCYKRDGVNSYYDDYDNDARRGMYRKGVRVNGFPNCIVLYPDGYNGTKVQDYDTQTYNTEEAYDAATAEGIVFLPANGYDGIDENNGAEHIQSVGAYWSSTPNPGIAEYAHALYFQSFEDKAGWLDRRVNPKGDIPRDCRCSVRLVRDITIPAN